MKKHWKKITLGILALATVAAVTVGPTYGLIWTVNADPTVAPGVSAPANQFVIRTDIPGLYYKSGASNTAWTQIGMGTTSGVPSTRTLSATSPLRIDGGGTADLSANRTFSILQNTTAQNGYVTTAPNDPLQFWRGDASWSALPLNTTSQAGTVATAPNDTTKYWRGDATWSALNTSSIYYGTGTDGTCNFDGTTVVCGITPAAAGAATTRGLGFGPSFQSYSLNRECDCTDATVGTNVVIQGFSAVSNNTPAIRVQGTLTISSSGFIVATPAQGGNASGGIGGSAGAAGTNNFYGAGRSIGGAGGAQAGAGGAPSGGVNLPANWIVLSSANAPNVAAGVCQGGYGGKNEVGTGTSGTATTAVSTAAGVYAYANLNNLMSWAQGYAGTGTHFDTCGSGAGGRGSNAAGNGGGGGGGSSGWNNLYIYARKIVDNNVSGGGTDNGFNSTGVMCTHAICDRGGNGGDAQQTGCSTTCGGGGGGGGAGGHIFIMTEGACPSVDFRGGFGGAGAPAGSAGGNGGNGVLSCYHAGSY